MGKCNIFISKTAKKQGICELHYRRAGACSRRKTQKYNRSTKQKVLRLTVRYIGFGCLHNHTCRPEQAERVEGSSQFGKVCSEIGAKILRLRAMHYAQNDRPGSAA